MKDENAVTLSNDDVDNPAEWPSPAKLAWAVPSPAQPFQEQSARIVHEDLIVVAHREEPTLAIAIQKAVRGDADAVGRSGDRRDWREFDRARRTRHPVLYVPGGRLRGRCAADDEKSSETHRSGQSRVHGQ